MHDVHARMKATAFFKIFAWGTFVFFPMIGISYFFTLNLLNETLFSLTVPSVVWGMPLLFNVIDNINILKFNRACQVDHIFIVKPCNFCWDLIDCLIGVCICLVQTRCLGVLTLRLISCMLYPLPAGCFYGTYWPFTHSSVLW